MKNKLCKRCGRYLRDQRRKLCKSCDEDEFYQKIGIFEEGEEDEKD